MFCRAYDDHGHGANMYAVSHKPNDESVILGTILVLRSTIIHLKRLKYSVAALLSFSQSNSQLTTWYSRQYYLIKMKRGRRGCCRVIVLVNIRIIQSVYHVALEKRYTVSLKVFLELYKRSSTCVPYILLRIFRNFQYRCLKCRS